MPIEISYFENKLLKGQNTPFEHIICTRTTKCIDGIYIDIVTCIDG